jgi:hypothetical protein
MATENYKVDVGAGRPDTYQSSCPDSYHGNLTDTQPPWPAQEIWSPTAKWYSGYNTQPTTSDDYNKQVQSHLRDTTGSHNMTIMKEMKFNTNHEKYYRITMCIILKVNALS